MSIILASWKAEIKKTEVPDQSRQKVYETPSMVPACHPSNGRKLKIRSVAERLAQAKKTKFYLQNNQSKRAGDMAEVVE
jgi:hypothetical protein